MYLVFYQREVKIYMKKKTCLIIYNPRSGKGKVKEKIDIYEKLLLENRVGYICPANYSRNSELDATVRKVIDKMAIADELAREHEKQYNEAEESLKGK